MANPNQDICLSNPDFAVICSFLDRYGEMLGLSDISYKALQEWIEDARFVDPALIDLHCRMLRRIHKKLSNVSADRWERGIVKFCYKYSSVDAWELERFGYQIAKVSTKLTLLKNLLESQFDCNLKFRERLTETTPEEMRVLPVGRDKNGLAYWYMLDKDLNLRVYREDLDDVDAETWELVCRNREDLAKLITSLENGTEISLIKAETSDMSDASYKSEPTSDTNEDSRDSFRQKTPLGPSPLSFKVEPSDPDPTSSDSKPQLKFKISRLEADSPLKQLKDKFEKEKGSKLRKIKCKIKLESDTDNAEEKEKHVEGETTDNAKTDVKVKIEDVLEETEVKEKDENDDGETIEALSKEIETDTKPEAIRPSAQNTESTTTNEQESEKVLKQKATSDNDYGKSDEVETENTTVNLKSSDKLKNNSNTQEESQMSLNESNKGSEHKPEVSDKNEGESQKSEEISIETKNTVEIQDKAIDLSESSNVSEKKGDEVQKVEATEERKESLGDIPPENLVETKNSTKKKIETSGESTEATGSATKADNIQTDESKTTEYLKEDEGKDEVDGGDEVPSKESTKEESQDSNVATDNEKDSKPTQLTEKQTADIVHKLEEHSGAEETEATEELNECEEKVNDGRNEKPHEQSNHDIDSTIVSIKNSDDKTNKVNYGDSNQAQKTTSEELTVDCNKIVSETSIEISVSKTERDYETIDKTDHICSSDVEVKGSKSAVYDKEVEDTSMSDPEKLEMETVKNIKDEVISKTLKDQSLPQSDTKSSTDNATNIEENLKDENQIGDKSNKETVLEQESNANDASNNQKSDLKEDDIVTDSIDKCTEGKDSLQENTKGERTGEICSKEVISEDSAQIDETLGKGESVTKDDKTEACVEIVSETDQKCEEAKKEIVLEQTSAASENISPQTAVSEDEHKVKITTDEVMTQKESEQDYSNCDERQNTNKNMKDHSIKSSHCKDVSKGDDMSDINETTSPEASKKDVTVDKRNTEETSTAHNLEEEANKTEELEKDTSSEQNKTSVSDGTTVKEKLDLNELDERESSDKDLKEDSNTQEQHVSDKKEQVRQIEEKSDVTPSDNQTEEGEELMSENKNKIEEEKTSLPAEKTNEAAETEKETKCEADINDEPKTPLTTEEKSKSTTPNRKRKQENTKPVSSTDSTADEKEIPEIKTKVNRRRSRRTKAARRKVTRSSKVSKEAEDKLDNGDIQDRKGKEDHETASKELNGNVASESTENDIGNLKSDSVGTKRPKRGKKKNEAEETNGSVETKPEVPTDSGSEAVAAVKDKDTNNKQRSKAQKRQADDSPEECPVEPASKKSKLRGRVRSRGRGKRRVPVSENSSSSEDADDIPLSKVAGRGKGSNSRARGGKVGSQKSSPVAVRQNTRPSKKKKIDSDEEDVAPTKSKSPEPFNDDLNVSEDDMGRRRSQRVRNQRARKKSPTPEYFPSELEDFAEDFDDFDDEFTLKSKKKKKDAKFEEEEPTGRNAIRFAEKTKGKKKDEKVEEVEEDETPCCKCLRSEQPEWILLCDKCDAGYHTACLRPPLMIIPPGDWFCPPCEHSMLIGKLQENLKELDQSITKNDRLVRRKERLAYVSISLDNVLTNPEPGPTQSRRRIPKYLKEESMSSSSSSSSSSGTSSESSESESESSLDDRDKQKQKFIQRACRTKNPISYKFEEFDEMIMGAIEEDLSIPKEPKPKKVKPPGISRGKDMSNILGASDEEEKQKKPRKRRPRLTELDEEVDDEDDTDDYKLSSATEVSESKSSEFDSDQASEDSVARKSKKSKPRSRSKRKPSRRTRTRAARYRDEFVVDSEFESEEDNRRRSSRKVVRKKRVNYRELNSDDTEVDERSEKSFNTSDLDDSEFETKRKKEKKRREKVKDRERPRSGKRRRIKRVSSSESSEESEESTPKSKKKPPRKSARYEDDESSTGASEEEKTKEKKDKKSRILDDSEATEDEAAEESSTDASEEEPKQTKVAAAKKCVIKSESESDDEKEQHTDDEDSEATENEGEWEEIGVDSEDEKTAGKSVSPKKVVKRGSTSPSKQPKKVSEVDAVEKDVSDKVGIKDDSEAAKTPSDNVTEPAGDKVVEPKNVTQSEPEESQKEKEDRSELKESSSDISPSKLSSDDTSPKKKRGRKPKVVVEEKDAIEPAVKKRSRKPKAAAKSAEQETTEESPVKKKCNRKQTNDLNDEQKAAKQPTKDVKVKPEGQSKPEDAASTTPEKTTETDNIQDKTAEAAITDSESTVAVDRKDDSPLSARNKHNAPVGVVKPEVRQGVIVENKQALENRPLENRSGSGPMVNPLQSMQEMATGNQMMPGSGQSGFRPYPTNNYPGRNMDNFGGQQGYGNYQQQGQYGPSPNTSFSGPMPPGVQGGMSQGQGTPGGGMMQGPMSPQFQPNNQGPISPNSYHQSNQYNMPQGPPGYYSGPPFGPQMSHGGPQGGYGGYGPGFPPHAHGPPQGPNYQQGPYPQNYPPQGHSQGPYPNQPGPHGMGSQGPYPAHQQGQSYQGMPYNYPHMPQPRHPAGFGPPPQQQLRKPQPKPQQAPMSPNQRPMSPPMSPNRGPMSPNRGPMSPNQGPMSPNQSQRPMAPPRQRMSSPGQQSPNTTTRPDSGDPASRRGFMMDNILKSNPEQSQGETAQRGENPDEVDEIVKYVTHDKYFKEH